MMPPTDYVRTAHDDLLNSLEAEFKIAAYAMIVTNRIIWLLAFELPPDEKTRSLCELRVVLKDLSLIRLRRSGKPPKARVFYRNLYIKRFSGNVRCNLAARLHDFGEIWPRSKLSMAVLKAQVKELHVRVAADLARGEIPEAFIADLKARSDRISALYHQWSGPSEPSV
jgi:hypothetical protein